MKFFAQTFLILILACSATQAAKRVAVARSSGGDGFFLEPALGYSSGVLTQDGVSDIGTQTVNVEAKIGYKYDSFSVGLGYLMGIGTGEQAGNKGDFKPTDMSLYLGYEVFGDFNLTAGYLFSAKTKIQSSENTADFSGQGTKFGLSYSGLSWCSLVAESVARTYSKYDGTVLGKSIKDSTFSVSMSFPLR